MSNEELIIIIRSFMKKNKLTQKEFAELSCVGARTVTRILNGKANPTMKIVNKILAVAEEVDKQEIQSIEIDGTIYYYIEGYSDAWKLCERVALELGIVAYDRLGNVYLRKLPDGRQYITAVEGQGAKPITCMGVRIK